MSIYFSGPYEIKWVVDGLYTEQENFQPWEIVNDTLVKMGECQTDFQSCYKQIWKTLPREDSYYFSESLSGLPGKNKFTILDYWVTVMENNNFITMRGAHWGTAQIEMLDFEMENSEKIADSTKDLYQNRNQYFEQMDQIFRDKRKTEPLTCYRGITRMGGFRQKLPYFKHVALTQMNLYNDKDFQAYLVHAE